MKKLGIVVVVLVVLLLVLPFGMGKLAEKRVNEGLDLLVQEAPYLKVSERNWSGGWFKSKQDVTFEFVDITGGKLTKAISGSMQKAENAEAQAALDAEGTEKPAGDAAASGADAAAGGEAPTEEESTTDAPAAAAAPIKFTVHNDVVHGPILGFSGFGLARVDSHIDFPAEAVKEIEKVFGPKPALEVSTRVHLFGGGATTTFTSEGRKLIIKDDKTDVSYETFKMSVGVGSKFDSYDVDGKLPSLIVKNKAEEGVFTLTGLTIKGDGKRVLGDLFDGDFIFNIKQIKYADKSKPDALLIEDAHYVVDTKTKDDYSSIGAQFGTGVVKSPEIAEKKIDIKEIHYNFSLRHMHAPTLAKMFQGMRELYSKQLTDPANVEAAMFGPMKEHAGELLAHDPQLGIDRIGMVTSDGEIVAKGLIKLAGATLEDFSAPGGMGLIGKLDADITIEAAQKLIEKFPNGATMAGGAVDGGYAKRDGDKLVCHLEFKNGQLKINGKPQAIPGLGGPPPGAGGAEGMPPQE